MSETTFFNGRTVGGSLFPFFTQLLLPLLVCTTKYNTINAFGDKLKGCAVLPIRTIYRVTSRWQWHEKTHHSWREIRFGLLMSGGWEVCWSTIFINHGPGLLTWPWLRYDPEPSWCKCVITSLSIFFCSVNHRSMDCKGNIVLIWKLLAVVQNM